MEPIAVLLQENMGSRRLRERHSEKFGKERGGSGFVMQNSCLEPADDIHQWAEITKPLSHR